MAYKLAYVAAMFKFRFLKALTYLFYPWMNDLGVRIYTHFRTFETFKEVYIQAKHARETGQDYIEVEKKDPPKPQDTSKIKHLKNHKRKAKK